MRQRWTNTGLVCLSALFCESILSKQPALKAAIEDRVEIISPPTQHQQISKSTVYSCCTIKYSTRGVVLCCILSYNTCNGALTSIYITNHIACVIIIISSSTINRLLWPTAQQLSVIQCQPKCIIREDI